MQFIAQLNQRFGAAIQQEVLREATQGRSIAQERVSALTTALATLIRLTPALLGALGLWLVVMGWDSWPVIGFSALLIGAAVYLLPRRARNTTPTLRRTDAPALFALLDSLTDALNAPAITGVQIDTAVNASITTYPGADHVITFGAPLWQALTPNERLAVLAHEVAHLVNNDPARTQITGAAMLTLARWRELFEPPALIDHDTRTEIIIDDRSFGGQIVSGIFGGAVRALAPGFEKLVFAESQRAEYRADILAAVTAGATPLSTALEKLIRARRAYEALSHVYYDGSKPVPVFAAMAKALQTPDPDLASEAAQSLHTVDSTHPPTRFRQEVLAALTGLPNAVRSEQFDWTEIDAELAASIAKSEGKVLSEILVQ